MHEKVVALFQRNFGRAPSAVCRAPGRIEFIGNHTDYNGGVVMGAAIDRGLWVAVAPRPDGQRRYCSDLGGSGVIEQRGALAQTEGAGSWTNYPNGVLAGMPEFGVTPPNGFDYAVVSDLPTGAGLSSSAAIELASGLAFLALAKAELPRAELVKLGRWAENHFVGVPCGILDQGVSGFGQRDCLVHIDCATLAFSTVPMPAGAHFWIFNTPAEHALVDGAYAARHRECMLAAEALGVSLLAESNLAALAVAEGKMDATAFKRARHVLSEIERVNGVQAALAVGDMAAVGRHLTASHRSSQHDFENSTAQLDDLVDRLTTRPGVWGARLTGGGFGGAVMALTDASFDAAAAQAVSDEFAARWGEPSAALHLLTANGAERIS